MLRGNADLWNKPDPFSSLRLGFGLYKSQSKAKVLNNCFASAHQRDLYLFSSLAAQRCRCGGGKGVAMVHVSFYRNCKLSLITFTLILLVTLFSDLVSRSRFIWSLLSVFPIVFSSMRSATIVFRFDFDVFYGFFWGCLLVLKFWFAFSV